MKLKVLAATVAAAGALAVLPAGIATAAQTSDTAVACCKPPKVLVGTYPTLAECQAHQGPNGECKRGGGGWQLWETVDPVEA